jgi:TRAP-type transport system periplasmic protein
MHEGNNAGSQQALADPPQTVAAHQQKPDVLPRRGSMLRKITGVAIAATLLATPAMAETITLKFNSPAPPPSFLHTYAFRPWISDVEKASKGTLKIQLYVGGTLGNFKVNYDRVVSDVADIGFILTSFAGGKFKKMDVAELPFQSKNSVEAGYALWKMYEKGLFKDEFDKVVPLAIWTFPNAGLHTKKKIESLNDLKGMKLVTSNVATSKIAELLGAVPVTFTPADAYQAISRGIAEGALMPFTGMKIFKIDEVTSHHLNEPLGASSAMMFMNKQKYDSLPPDAKAAIDKFSGLAMSERTAKAVDTDWAKSLASVKAGTNQLSPQEEKKWEDVTRPVVSGWTKSAPDGDKMLKAFQDEIKDHRSKAMAK